MESGWQRAEQQFRRVRGTDGTKTQRSESRCLLSRRRRAIRSAARGRHDRIVQRQSHRHTSSIGTGGESAAGHREGIAVAHLARYPDQCRTTIADNYANKAKQADYVASSVNDIASKELTQIDATK